MGIYYFILLFIGIGFSLVGGYRFILERKRGWMAAFGVIMISVSIYLFQPGSSDTIAGLLGID